MNVNGIETERKFIIKMPEEDVLSALGGDDIVQIYLECEAGMSERVRARTHGGAVTYTHTVKRRINAISAYEDERDISEAEFAELSARIEPGTTPVRKTRYLLPYRDHVFEIDVYPQWRRFAVMEVELPGEDAVFEVPPQICVLREVSGERRFSNHSLSRRMIPEEELGFEDCVQDGENNIPPEGKADDDKRSQHNEDERLYQQDRQRQAAAGELL